MSRAYYISDNRNIGNPWGRFIDTNGIISTPALTSTDTTWLNNGGMSCPWGICLDPTNRYIYVVDECVGAKVVWQIDTQSGPPWNVVPVFGDLGYGPPALNFNHRYDIYDCRCDHRGNLYVSDATTGSIIGVNVVNASSQVMCGVSIAFQNAAYVAGGAVSGNSYSTYYAIAFDLSDNLYSTDESFDYVVWKINQSTGANTVFAGMIGVDSDAGDGGPPTSASLYSPFGIAMDNVNDLLYIITGTNGSASMVPQRIRVVNFGASAKSPGGVTVLPNTINTIKTYPVTGVVNTDPSLWWLETDNNMGVYVCDVHPRGSGCWVHFLDSSGGYNLVAGTGTCGAGGDGGPATSAILGEAFALALLPASFCGGMSSQAVGNPLI